MMYYPVEVVQTGTILHIPEAKVSIIAHPWYVLIGHLFNFIIVYVFIESPRLCNNLDCLLVELLLLNTNGFIV